MSACRYRNDINKIIHFEKNCKNAGRKLRFLVPCTPPELKNIINRAVSNLIPEKYKRQYEKCYSDFRD
jgi:hypothetical protein